MINFINASPYQYRNGELVFRRKKHFFGLFKSNCLSFVETYFHGFEDGTEYVFKDLVKNIPNDYSFDWINFEIKNESFYIPINNSLHEKILENIKIHKKIIIPNDIEIFFTKKLLKYCWINNDKNSDYYILEINGPSKFIVKQKNILGFNYNHITLMEQFEFDLFLTNVSNKEYNYLNKNNFNFKNNENIIIELLKSCEIEYRYN